MRGDPLLAVKCYSLLFINLRNEMWTSFILCQSFLMDAISLRAHSADEEYTEYFVSFLKSLSIRINQSQVTLFFNKVLPAPRSATAPSRWRWPPCTTTTTPTSWCAPAS
jgi:hypothetical protein